MIGLVISVWVRFMVDINIVGGIGGWVNGNR